MSDWPIVIRVIDEIDARVTPHDWRFRWEQSDRIAAHWRDYLAKKPALYDGRVLLLSRAEFTAAGGRRVFRGAHFETDFSAFIAWRDFGFPDPNVRNCFSMAALSGNDGGFILAEMGGHTANSGKIYFPAGTPDPSDIVGDTLDLAGSARRELFEETGLAAHEARFDPDWIIVDAGPRLACMKLTHVDAPAAAVARDLNARIAAQTDAELAGMRVARDVGDIDVDRMPDFIIAYLRHMFATR